MQEKTIYIAGLGLIGSSLALGIKKAHPTYTILGYNRGEESRRIALEKGIVAKATSTFSEFAPLADIIILAVPIEQINAFIKELAQLPLKEGVIVTDAGSTKAAIVKTAEDYFDKKGIIFIGGHPMAGSHKSGAAAADRHLFENAYYILTPSQLTKSDTSAAIKDLFKGLNAKFVEVEATEHDKVTSQVSHFPHILASSLVHQSQDYHKEHDLVNYLAAGSFRDMTRIAESEPGMWASIVMTNQDNIIDRINHFKGDLEKVVDLIQSQDSQAIWRFFDEGRLLRKQMTIHKRSGGDRYYDLSLAVPDQEDVVLKILEHLRGISIVNIHINEVNREDLNGILQISFKNDRDRQRARQILEKKTNYKINVLE